MQLNVKEVHAKIMKYYLSRPGYSYVNDVFLSYQEAILIHFVLTHLDRDFIDSIELDNQGRKYRFWWEECAGSFANFVHMLEPWDEVLKDRRTCPSNFFYENNGKRVPWKRLSKAKKLMEYEKRLKNPKGKVRLPLVGNPWNTYRTGVTNETHPICENAENDFVPNKSLLRLIAEYEKLVL